jgi:hypothetical protein
VELVASGTVTMDWEAGMGRARPAPAARVPNQLSAPFRMGLHAAWDTEVGGQLLDSASIRLHPNLNARPRREKPRAENRSV